MWEVLWGWVVNRASHSLEIRQMFGFRCSGYKPGCRIVSKKLPFYHWGQIPVMQQAPAGLAALALKEQQCAGGQDPRPAPSSAPVRQHTGLSAFPSRFWGSPSLSDRTELLSVCKGGNVSNKILINECTEHILLSVLPLQPH